MCARSSGLRKLLLLLQMMAKRREEKVEGQMGRGRSKRNEMQRVHFLLCFCYY